jgi:hypothetical protein
MHVNILLVNISGTDAPIIADIDKQVRVRVQLCFLYGLWVWGVCLYWGSCDDAF